MATVYKYERYIPAINFPAAKRSDIKSYHLILIDSSQYIDDEVNFFFLLP